MCYISRQRMIYCRKLGKSRDRTTMSRPGVDYETVKQTAVKLLSQGIAPSVQKIREELGTGSNSTIADHLKVWRDEYAKKTVYHLPSNMPKELISTFEVLWQTAMEHAQNQLAEYKKVVESECEAALQKEKDAEKAVADFQLKLERLSCILEQEIANKHKITVELAISNDRLIKQDEALTAQKNQYEDRLKRVYEEKDNFITECHRFQTEIKTLHEKLASQAVEQQQLLAQQNALQEQSEARWLKLIDQARLETKDERKKLENIRHQNNEQIKKLESQLINAQKESHEKDAQLHSAQERISQLRQEVKFLETEFIKSRAIIMKFEEEQKLKKVVTSHQKKSKIEEHYKNDK
jgi:chromosome segregation ATPase